MKAQLTITIDPAFKAELQAFAKAHKQSVSEFITNTLKKSVHPVEREHIKIAPFVMGMTSDLQLPVDAEALDAYIEAMEVKYK